jgi:hypothetical protein
LSFVAENASISKVVGSCVPFEKASEALDGDSQPTSTSLGIDAAMFEYSL